MRRSGGITRLIHSSTSCQETDMNCLCSVNLLRTSEQPGFNDGGFYENIRKLRHQNFTLRTSYDTSCWDRWEVITDDQKEVFISLQWLRRLQPPQPRFFIDHFWLSINCFVFFIFIFKKKVKILWFEHHFMDKTTNWLVGKLLADTVCSWCDRPGQAFRC